MSNTDNDLIRCVVEGDREVYGKLVEIHQDRLRAVVSRYCLSEYEVEECMQEAFVRAYISLKKHDARRSFFSWVSTIAINWLRDEARRKTRSREHAIEYYDRLRVLRIDEPISASDFDRRRGALQECLETLPGRQEQLAREKYEERVSFATLAERFKASVPALKMRLMRLRQTLRECIERRIKTAKETG